MCSSLGLCASWTLLTIFFPMLGKFLAIISSNIFSGPFCLSASYGTPRMWMLMHLMCHRSLWLSSFFLIFFFYILLCGIDLYHCALQVIYLFSASVVLLLIPSSVLFSLCFLFFSSSRSLVCISCISSIVFPRSLIVFIIIILNSFSGRLPISSSFSCFLSGFILSLHLADSFLLFHPD